MTQATLALRIGVSLATIRNWERSERLPRISAPIKASIAEVLRLSLADLEAVGRGERKDVPIGAVRVEPFDARPTVQIENYERARHFLRGASTTEFVQEGGVARHRFASPSAREFAWIVEDDCMSGPGGYELGDLLFMVECKSMPAGSDVMIEVGGKGFGAVRRIYYQEDRAVLVALKREVPPQFVPLKDVSRMCRVIGFWRAT